MSLSDRVSDWKRDGVDVVAAVDGHDNEGVIVARSGTFYLEAFDSDGASVVVVLDPLDTEELARGILRELWS